MTAHCKQQFQKWVSAIALTAFCAQVSGCSTAKKTEEEYVPSKKVVEIKSEQVFYRVWDKWSHRMQFGLLGEDGHRFEEKAVYGILADDPSPTVFENVQRAETFRDVTTASLVVGELALVVAIVLIAVKAGPNGAGVSDLAWIIPSGITVLGLSVGGMFHHLRNSASQAALTAHNERVLGLRVEKRF